MGAGLFGTYDVRRSGNGRQQPRFIGRHLYQRHAPRLGVGLRHRLPTGFLGLKNL